jgi:hypothetical protein
MLLIRDGWLRSSFDLVQRVIDQRTECVPMLAHVCADPTCVHALLPEGALTRASTLTQDHDEGGVTEAQPVERNPEVYRSLLSYVSDARKEEIYRLHKLDPTVYDAAVLSYLFNLSRVRVEAIIRVRVLSCWLSGWLAGSLCAKQQQQLLLCLA